MQTFLPYPSFQQSAGVLDDQRLGKQRVETLQILRSMHLEDYGWQSHPVVQMWRGHTRALVAYGLAIIDEWFRRGRPDTTRPEIVEFAAPYAPLHQEALDEELLPPWLGWEPLHRSHQSALVRKDPAFYRHAFPDVPDDLPYEWPEPAADWEPAVPFSAWVVRGGSRSDSGALLRAGTGNDQGPPVEPTGRIDADGRIILDPRVTGVHATPKQRRQRRVFESVMQPGEPVVVPVGDQLLVGVLEGGPPSSEGGVLTRRVSWRRAVRRAELRRPYQLQDPRTVFPLRGEDVVDVDPGSTKPSGEQPE